MAEAKSEKKTYEYLKPHVNVATLGHVDHGKTTLTSAITYVLARENKATFRKYEEIDKAPEEKARGITISVAHNEFETDARHYSLIDCPGHADYIKNMITGAAQANGGILVIDASQGQQTQTREHLLLAKQVGIDKLVIFANKTDLVTDNEMLELVKEDIRDLLEKYGFDKNSPIIFGSAKKALEENPGPNEPLGYYQSQIKELIAKIDEYIPTPPSDEDKPFLMYIEDVFTITGRGTVVTGRVERGTLTPGNEVEVLGMGKEKIKTKVTSAEIHNKVLNVVKPNLNAALLLQGIKREQVERGMAVSKPGSINIHKKFEAQVYALTKDEGGRHSEFEEGYKPQFYFYTADISGAIKLPEGKKTVNPGDNLSLIIELIQPVAVEDNSTFSIREGRKTVGKGIITKIIE
jgi:elongation factor Tu